MSPQCSTVNRCLRNSNDHRNGAPSQPENKPWITSWNFLFVHSDIDDAEIPPRPFRVLLHLQRRIGKRTAKNARINPGIDSIAKVCRMHKETVIEALRWLKEHDYLEIAGGRGGQYHHYKVLLPDTKLYIHSWLDQAKLSVPEMRVLAHLCRLGDLTGTCYINHEKFALVCRLNKRTVIRALKELDDRGYCIPIDDRKNPQFWVRLDEVFKQEQDEERLNKRINKAAGKGAINNLVSVHFGEPVPCRRGNQCVH